MALRELHRLLPRENILYLADRKHAPYGTKTKEEIIKLTKSDIKRLKTMGAEKILIACCTASSVHSMLEGWEREISIPIIKPAAALAAKTGRRVAVIATNYTANNHIFRREIEEYKKIDIFEFGEQELVRMVEMGCRDKSITKECEKHLLRIAERTKRLTADTLILGCTHFSHLEGRLKTLLPNTNIINPVKEGATTLAEAKNQSKEQAKILYTE